MSDELDRIKEISIVDHAKYMGFTVKKVGRFYTLKEHDSVRIDPDRNIYKRFSTNEGGSIIDFVKNFNYCSVKEAIQDLKKIYGIGDTEYIKPKQTTKKEIKEELTKENIPKPIKKELELPQRADTMRNVIAYLTKTRKIDIKIVQEMIDRKMLYQDIHNNCVFVSRNEEGEPVFANFRGSNTFKRFLGDCKGSDYDHCFLVNNDSNTLIVTESVIDAMSVMEIYDITSNIKNKHQEYDFLALSGVAKYSNPILHHIKENGYTRVFLALDNDEAGNLATKEIRELLESEYPNIIVKRITPKEKDFNDSLQSYKNGIEETAMAKRQRQYAKEKEEVEI